MKAWWRWPLGIVSAGVCVVGIIGYLMFYGADVRETHRELVRAGEAGVSPILTYSKCLQQSACSSWFYGELGGEFSPLWTSVLGVGLLGVVVAVVRKRNKQTYSGGFSLRNQLKNLRIENL